MIKPKLRLINNVDRLKLTIEVLEGNLNMVQQGKRFDHLTNGHESYVELVTSELENAKRRAESFKE